VLGVRVKDGINPGSTGSPKWDLQRILLPGRENIVRFLQQVLQTMFGIGPGSAAYACLQNEYASLVYNESADLHESFDSKNSDTPNE